MNERTVKAKRDPLHEKELVLLLDENLKNHFPVTVRGCDTVYYRYFY